MLHKVSSFNSTPIRSQGVLSGLTFCSFNPGSTLGYPDLSLFWTITAKIVDNFCGSRKSGHGAWYISGITVAVRLCIRPINLCPGRKTGNQSSSSGTSRDFFILIGEELLIILTKTLRVDFRCNIKPRLSFMISISSK
jgi:hypothetical protein